MTASLPGMDDNAARAGRYVERDQVTILDEPASRLRRSRAQSVARPCPMGCWTDAHQESNALAQRLARKRDVVNLGHPREDRQHS
jgi:hypothetical protein